MLVVLVSTVSTLGVLSVPSEYCQYPRSTALLLGFHKNNTSSSLDALGDRK
jgi:hypothetical protein